MKIKRAGPRLPLAQFVAIIALSISVFLIVDLGRRAAANYRVQREAYRLTQEVEAMHQHQAKLLARRTYVASDLYVEEVARNELKWARPGETVIVILPTLAVSADQPTSASPQANLQQTAQTPAEAWWFLFFGDQANAPLTSPPDFELNSDEASRQVSINDQ